MPKAGSGFRAIERGNARGTLAPLTDLRLLGRHQVAAAIGTSADFGAMILLVELLSWSPPAATMLSATCGAITNFALSRAWVFHGVHRGSLASQAVRYGIVSFGGALLNAVALMLVLAAGIGIPYGLARVLVSVTVSLSYTYPLHTRFVFRGGGPELAAPDLDVGAGS